MPRDLTSEVQAEIAGARNRPFHLFEAQLSGVVVRNSDLPYNVTWNNVEWVGNGHFVGFEQLQESADLEIRTVRVHLSGVDQEWIAHVLSHNYINRPITIWRGFLDASGAIVVDPYVHFSGTMDRPTITDNPERDGTSTVTVIATNHLADWDFPRGRRSNHEDSRLFFPDERGFEYVSQINRQVVWGRR